MTSVGDDAYSRQDWLAAFEAYSAVDSLDAASSERLAVAAYLIAENDACERAWEGAYRASLDTGDEPNAARCACWLALFLFLHGQRAKASGWLARAERLIEGVGESAASGYRLVPAVLEALDSGDAAGALELSRRNIELGARFGDADLVALAILGQGQALIALGDRAGGVAHLDEVMVSVVAGCGAHRR
jgi:hypothetical protein